MTADEMEAESWKYVRAIFLVPLSSGRVALFRQNFTRFAICEWADVKETFETKWTPAPVREPSVRVLTSRADNVIPNVSLEDLDL